MRNKEPLDPVDIDIGPGCVTLHDRSITLRRPHVLPFLKWAGGKQWLARIAYIFKPTLLKGTYYEPFLGGGSLFFALNPKAAVLSDCNKELIVTYKAVASKVDSVIAELQSYPYDRDFYNRLRTESPLKYHARAARFIYLNKTAWNGLYRVNLKGEFNVPFGKYERVTICPEDRLRGASKGLAAATFRCCDFETTAADASRGDFVYFDPPYITTHNNNGFLKYNAKLFSWDDQVRLSKLARRLKKKGVHVVVSNADHQPVVDLYEDFYCYRVRRNSLIGGDIDSRRRTAEVIMTSFPLSPTVEVRANGCP